MILVSPALIAVIVPLLSTTAISSFSVLKEASKSFLGSTLTFKIYLFPLLISIESSSREYLYSSSLCSVFIWIVLDLSSIISFSSALNLFAFNSAQ
jgi:hypothetical protein